jgi:spore coat protein U-like protein
MRYTLRLFVCVCLLLPNQKLLAATASGTLSVSATVVGTCTVNTSTAINFMAYNTVSGNTATGVVSVTCTGAITGYAIGLDAGGGGSGASANNPRLMQGSGTAAGTTLAYSLFQDAGHGTVWGNTQGVSGNTLTATGTTPGIASTYNVYGLIASGLTPVSGGYADIVNVFVYFTPV